MFLSRTEGMLGNIPVQYRLASARKRKLRQNSTCTSEDQNFFGTSSLSNESENQTREHEVSRLFSRMRAELISIAKGFADEEEEKESSPAAARARQGIFIEMIVASEFLMDEIDAEIVRLCQDGQDAQENRAVQENKAAVEKLQEICKLAIRNSKLRDRISEFQRELDSMVEVTQLTFQRYSVSASLDYDPFADQGCGTHSFLDKFTKSVDQTISILAQLSFTALQNRDFETVAELCSCNVQLSNFLSDAKRINSL